MESMNILNNSLNAMDEAEHANETSIVEDNQSEECNTEHKLLEDTSLLTEPEMKEDLEDQDECESIENIQQAIIEGRRLALENWDTDMQFSENSQDSNLEELLQEKIDSFCTQLIEEHNQLMKGIDMEGKKGLTGLQETDELETDALEGLEGAVGRLNKGLEYQDVPPMETNEHSDMIHHCEKSTVDQPEPEVPGDYLTTLSNAALTCKVSNGIEMSDDKKEPIWCDVGIIRSTSCSVISYYEPDFSHDQEYDGISSESLPDFGNGFEKIKLEPGTVYKFRVAAINSCGRGPWSEISTFKTNLSYPNSPSSIKIIKSAQGAHLYWEPPSNPDGNIIEYSVYLAVRNTSHSSNNNSQLYTFIQVYSGPQNQTIVPFNLIATAHIDTTSKPGILFRIAAKNEFGFGVSIQVRWLQGVIASSRSVVKTIQKKKPR